jgi:hypothetical protein
MMPRCRAIIGFLKDDWSEFRKICNRRWAKISKDLIEGRFSTSKVLGSGYFGVVISTTNKKLVIKITSDQDEGYFNKIVMSDDYLRYNPGLPLLLDCFYIPEWNAHVILRENVKYGIDNLPESSPLSRSIDILDQFGESARRIETKVTNVLKSLQSLNAKQAITRSDFAYAFREAQGQTRTEILKALKKLPDVSENSKYYFAMDVIRYSLDKYGIALWDLHDMNLGRHKFEMSNIDPLAPELNTKCILILDVGGNFGSPIMAQDIDSIDI